MKTTAFLYIDDSQSSRDVMRLMLTEMLDYEDLTMLSDSDKLIDKLKQMNRAFDVIFLDINVQPLDGYTICELLRNEPDYKQARIIAVTATVKPSDLERMRVIGFNGAISKPLDMEVFPTQVDMIIKGNDLWEAM